MSISLREHSEPEEFFRQIRALLEPREAEYSLLWGLLEVARRGAPKVKPTMLECCNDGQTVGAAMAAGLHLIVTAGLAPFTEPIVKFLLENKVSLPGVIGPEVDAEEFAKKYSLMAGCQMRLAMRQRLYELRDVHWPNGISGEHRLVNEGDIPLLSTWLEEFYLDAIPWELPSREKIRQNAEARIQQGMTFFWEDGVQPVAMAALSRPSEKGITINAVYTPKPYRRKGYATALVAAISAEGLNRGKKFCVLYTDLNNPTSNSIYQKVGYRPVADSKNYIFDPQPALP